MLKLNTGAGLSVADYFTPLNQAALNIADLDFGGGSATILVDQPNAPIPHLIVGGGKDGNLFVVNRDNMGKFNSSSNNVVQTIDLGGQIYNTPAFWQGNLYISSGGPLEQYIFSATNGLFSVAS